MQRPVLEDLRLTASQRVERKLVSWNPACPVEHRIQSKSNSQPRLHCRLPPPRPVRYLCTLPHQLPASAANRPASSGAAAAVVARGCWWWYAAGGGGMDGSRREREGRAGERGGRAGGSHRRGGGGARQRSGGAAAAERGGGRARRRGRGGGLWRLGFHRGARAALLYLAR